jgi:hypothetical protein
MKPESSSPTITQYRRVSIVFNVRSSSGGATLSHPSNGFGYLFLIWNVLASAS